MELQNIQSVSNFDFLARSFAHMAVMGLSVNLSEITGNMPEELRRWFCRRYVQYYKHEIKNITKFKSDI
ncbi:cell surface composition regulator GlgS [Klebsiella variicola]|uniref:cell surface composition regulator GlgS n=1 Tax=Klebsiella variicola TaxID=244366 RepID=UPI003D95C219